MSGSQGSNDGSLAGLVLGLFFGSLLFLSVFRRAVKVVSSSEVMIIERCGRFHKVYVAGGGCM